MKILIVSPVGAGFVIKTIETPARA